MYKCQDCGFELPFDHGKKNVQCAICTIEEREEREEREGAKARITVDEDKDWLLVVQELLIGFALMIGGLITGYVLR